MVYHIPSGVTITAISNNLEEQGIIRSSFFVRAIQWLILFLGFDWIF
jgi:cell division protein YceG involved in septum cleavage